MARGKFGGATRRMREKKNVALFGALRTLILSAKCGMYESAVRSNIASVGPEPDREKQVLASLCESGIVMVVIFKT